MIMNAQKSDSFKNPCQINLVLPQVERCVSWKLRKAFGEFRLLSSGHLSAPTKLNMEISLLLYFIPLYYSAPGL